MKGIAGIVYPDVFQMNDRVPAMLSTLKHRGEEPVIDLHVYKNIQLGVIGGKIASNEKRTILAQIDGLIINYEELRCALANDGFHFKSKDPAELLVYGYEKWDTAVFDRILGEFALFIFDQRKRRIILCRDRIGKKPLYWYHNTHYFIFGSELKSLLATGAVPQTPALDSLSSYLYLGYIPQDMSPILDVNKLLPAHYLQYNFDGSKTIHTYWSYSSCFEKQNTSPLNVIVKELDQLIRENVLSSISKNEKAGSFISGGLGSACMTKYLSELMPKENITAFTVGFSGEDDEDAEAARDVAHTLGIRHEVSTLAPSHFFKDLVKICWHLDEPLADPHIVSTWNLAALAAKKTHTVISGMGSDELFAGHSRYSIAEQRSSTFQITLQLLLNTLRRAMIPLFKNIYTPFAFQLLKESRTNPWQFDYVEQNALMDEKELYKASPRLGGIFDPEVFLHKFHHLPRVKSTVASYLYFDVKTRLPDEYLLQFERLTAAHGLRWRVPFLDRRVVEFVARLPEPQFLKESETGSYLKAMMKGKLPESIVDRPKRTRKQFLRTWVEKGGTIKIFSLLESGSLVESGMISKLWIQKKIAGLATEAEAFIHLWSILQLEIWFRIYINKPIQSHPPEITLEDFLREPA